MYLSFSKQFSSQMFKTKTEFLVPILIYFPPSLIVKLNKKTKQSKLVDRQIPWRNEFNTRNEISWNLRKNSFASTQSCSHSKGLFFFSAKTAAASATFPHQTALDCGSSHCLSVTVAELLWKATSFEVKRLEVNVEGRDGIKSNWSPSHMGLQADRSRAINSAIKMLNVKCCLVKMFNQLEYARQNG